MRTTFGRRLTLADVRRRRQLEREIEALRQENLRLLAENEHLKNEGRGSYRPPLIPSEEIFPDQDFRPDDEYLRPDWRDPMPVDY